MIRSGWPARAGWTELLMAAALLLVAPLSAVAAGGAQAGVTQAATAAATPSAASLGLVPAPSSITLHEGSFTLSSDTEIVTDHDLRAVGTLFGQMLAPATGFTLKLQPQPAPKSDVILMVVDATLERLGQEGYLLDITPDRVVIRVFGPAGAFYATQTLRQLLPAGAVGTARATGPWTLPALAIEDVPRFGWRGLLLDSARHFIPKREILKFIDLLALHKMNVLHWHLTDDQGWRIEIKKYPKLTAVGARRRESQIGGGSASPSPPVFDGKPHAGFYSQGDVREVIAYARARFVTIVPEIDLPGHMQAALAAYPEFGTSATPVEVATTWGVHPHLLNAGEPAMQFVQDVLTEVLALFPGRFIHIGGDEAPLDAWKSNAAVQARIKELGLKDEAALFNYVIERVDGFVSRRGRRLVGWDEILGANLAPGATIMSWRGADRARAALREGRDVVMTPQDPLYFDRPQATSASTASTTGTPADTHAAAPPNTTRANAGEGGNGTSLDAGTPAPTVALEQVYAYDPAPASLTPSEAQHVLGAQGQLFTEHIATPEALEAMAFPRTIALAEITWSPIEGRSLEDFRGRLKLHEARLKALGLQVPLPF